MKRGYTIEQQLNAERQNYRWANVFKYVAIGSLVAAAGSFAALEFAPQFEHDWALPPLFILIAIVCASASVGIREAGEIIEGNNQADVLKTQYEGYE